MGEGPLVSVIVPTYNRANLLREALDSIVSQEGAGQQFETEIIVVDDVSTDATAEVVTHYPNIRYIRLTQKRDLAGARNVGLAASHGGYVAFLDDDDLWLPHKLRVQLPVLAAHPEAGAVYSHVIVRTDGQEWVYPDAPQPPSGAIYRPLLRGNVCGNVLGFLLRRSALEAAGLFDETLIAAEDYDLWLRLAFRFPVLFLPGPVGVFRPTRHGKRATTLAGGKRGEEILRIAEKTLALLPDTAESTQLKQEARAWADARVVTELASARDARSVQPQMIEAVRRHPSILEDSDVRMSLASTARRSALASPSPISAIQAFCSEVAAAVEGNAPLPHDRRTLRRLLARIWADVAAGLFLGSPRRTREAWSAMAHAARQDPLHLTRTVLRILLKGAQCIKRAVARNA